SGDGDLQHEAGTARRRVVGQPPLLHRRTALHRHRGARGEVPEALRRQLPQDRQEVTPRTAAWRRRARNERPAGASYRILTSLLPVASVSGEDARGPHAGTAARTQVPPPGWASITSVPPRASTRSRIWRKPRPPALV